MLNGLPFPPPGDLPNPEMAPTSLGSAALAGRLFATEPPGSPEDVLPWLLLFVLQLLICV